MGVQGVDDRVDDFGLQIRRVGELLLLAVGYLLEQSLGLQQLAHDC